MTGSVVEFVPILVPPSWLNSALGRSRLTRVKHEGHSWAFDIGEHCTVRTESLWRVMTANGIIATSEDHGQAFGRVEPVDVLTLISETLTGPIVDVIVEPMTSDLRVLFREALFEIVATSSGHESWHITARYEGESLELIAMGDGRLSVPRGQRD